MEKLLSNYDKMVIIEAALKKGMSVKAIAELTDLSEAEVKEIVKSLTKEAA
jgi:DNA-binding NarL/FixJ family response regulator